MKIKDNFSIEKFNILNKKRKEKYKDFDFELFSFEYNENKENINDFEFEDNVYDIIYIFNKNQNNIVTLFGFKIFNK